MADSQRKTANLFDYETMLDGKTGYYLDASGNEIANAGFWSITKYIPVDGTVFTLTRTFIGNAPAICLYDSNKNFITGVSYQGEQVVTISSNTNAAYIRFSYFISEPLEDVAHDMLNKGNTALPYEPYRQHSLRKQCTATETIQSGDTIYADGTAATLSIKGNTVQNGTPTPDNPADVNGVGVRTDNLFDTFISGIAIDTVTGAEVPSSSGFTSDFIAVDDNSLYSYSGGNNTISTCFFAYDSAKAYIGRSVNTTISATTIQTVTIVTGGYTVFANSLTGNTNPIAYIRVSHLNGTQAAVDSETIMLNTGSTAKPYEPYGYKIPISSGGVTTNIYLGSTQSVRQIYKLVLTGDETGWIEVERSRGYRFNLPIISAMQSDTTVGVRSMCTHQTLVGTGETYIRNNAYTITANSELIMTLGEDTRLASWKSWLAAQYANGTPVTVLYVLATPETATVNEPLQKIGTYADSISGISLPTTDGANTITVDTTVQPSEFTATWTGWHNASVKEYDGSQWNE